MAGCDGDVEADSAPGMWGIFQEETGGAEVMQSNSELAPPKG
jgi:hypothetical protein